VIQGNSDYGTEDKGSAFINAAEKKVYFSAAQIKSKALPYKRLAEQLCSFLRIGSTQHGNMLMVLHQTKADDNEELAAAMEELELEELTQKRKDQNEDSSDDEDDDNEGAQESKTDTPNTLANQSAPGTSSQGQKSSHRNTPGAARLNGSSHPGNSQGRNGSPGASIISPQKLEAAAAAAVRKTAHVVSYAENAAFSARGSAAGTGGGNRNGSIGTTEKLDSMSSSDTDIQCGSYGEAYVCLRIYARYYFESY
jgi:hypothetical protein